MARQQRISLEPTLEADSLPLMRSIVAEARLYTVLPIHAVWSEVQDGRPQAAKIVSHALQRIVSMALARTKGPAKGVSLVASEIVLIVEDSARHGMWNAPAPA